jgi:acetone carboxylase gamma subunit
MLYRKFTIPNDKMIKSMVKDKDKFIKQSEIINQNKIEKEKEINKVSKNEKGEMFIEDSSNTTTFKLNIERQFMEYKDNTDLDSKKQAISNRITERDMISQRGCNPFLSQNNYINDLMNQEKYIRQNNNLNTSFE